jgi:hypothetical protein
MRKSGSNYASPKVIPQHLPVSLRSMPSSPQLRYESITLLEDTAPEFPHLSRKIVAEEQSYHVGALGNTASWT